MSNSPKFKAGEHIFTLSTPTQVVLVEKVVGNEYHLWNITNGAKGVLPLGDVEPYVVSQDIFESPLYKAMREE